MKNESSSLILFGATLPLSILSALPLSLDEIIPFSCLLLSFISKSF
jgi:hypothetical protein